MYDIQRVSKVIADIQRYLKELNSYNIKDEDDLLDGKNYNASSMLIFAVLNRVIDLGNEIISAENLGAPNTYQDIMPILAKAGFMNKKQSEELNKLISKRNILAHFYGEMNEKELFKTINDISLINNFIALIKKRVSKD